MFAAEPCFRTSTTNGSLSTDLGIASRFKSAAHTSNICRRGEVSPHDEKTAPFLDRGDSLSVVSAVKFKVNKQTQLYLGDFMNRRQFVRSTSIVAATSAVSLAAPFVFSASPAEDLLSTPERCVGGRFLLDNGKFVTLESVQVTSRDAMWHQWELRFASDVELSEGTFGLVSESGAAAVLYMQSAGKKTRASVSRRA
jgi:hypothetical protein